MAFKLRKIEAPERWKDLKAHPLACLAPYGQGIDTVQGAEFMRKVGYDQTEPIVLFDGQILDGRHKHVMAQESDETPAFVELVEGDLVEFVTKKLHRQHLTESQRAYLHAALEKAGSEAKTGNDFRLTNEAAAEALGVSVKTVQDANKVAAEASPAVQNAVASGEASVNDAAKAVRTVFCDRCARTGPTKGCQKCIEKRKRMGVSILKPAAVSKPKKSGSVKFDFTAYGTHLGFVVRGIDELGHAYPELKKEDQWVEIEKLRDWYCKVWEKLRKMALKIKV